LGGVQLCYGSAFLFAKLQAIVSLLNLAGLMDSVCAGRVPDGVLDPLQCVLFVVLGKVEVSRRQAVAGAGCLVDQESDMFFRLLKPALRVGGKKDDGVSGL
jgi:hypothetical protein